MASLIKNVKGFYLPAGEVHLEKFANKEGWLYQGHKYQEALTHCKQKRVAIDVGAHCGLWSIQMANDFEKIVAFEPIPIHRECYEMNIVDKNRILIPFALGDEDKTVKLKWDEKSTGSTYVSDEGNTEVEVRKLDDFDIKDVDFIKIDCEGYELFVLKGGERTVLEYKPVIIVEQKRNKGVNYGIGDTDAVDWLKERGYKLKKVIAGDYIMAL